MRSVIFVISVIAVVLIVGTGVALVYGFTMREVVVVQPIAFNHTVHVEEADLQCIDCHTNAETAVHAGLPGKAMCLDCHDIDEEEGTHPEKTKLFAFDETEQDIPWRRVAVTKPDVFFSHRRHVVSAQLDCLECHPDQPTLTEPPRTARLVMTMDDCIECHEQNGASSDCLACHR